MGELRFDERVVVVTGAGNGLGREHALLLGQRGAKVVVNDLGGEPQGGGASKGPAEAVAAEITQAGGEAVPDGNTVATPEGAVAIVRTALDSFGRIDALIHNAGITGSGPIEEVTPESLDRILDVHLRGGIFLAQSAWGPMSACGYGRILNVISNAGVFGLPRSIEYGAAKGALVALTKCLALSGAEKGIRVNALAPAAKTRLTRADFGPLTEWWEHWFHPARVSPAALWLVHEECPVTGEVYSAGGGRVARIFTGETHGIWSETMSPEEIRERFEELRAEDGYYQPKSSVEEMMIYREKIPDP